MGHSFSSHFAYHKNYEKHRNILHTKRGVQVLGRSTDQEESNRNMCENRTGSFGDLYIRFLPEFRVSNNSRATVTELCLRKAVGVPVDYFLLTMLILCHALCPCRRTPYALINFITLPLIRSIYTLLSIVMFWGQSTTYASSLVVRTCAGSRHLSHPSQPPDPIEVH
jgi:hypothetical protein